MESSQITIIPQSSVCHVYRPAVLVAKRNLLLVLSKESAVWYSSAMESNYLRTQSITQSHSIDIHQSILCCPREGQADVYAWDSRYLNYLNVCNPSINCCSEVMEATSFVDNKYCTPIAIKHYQRKHIIHRYVQIHGREGAIHEQDAVHILGWRDSAATGVQNIQPDPYRNLATGTFLCTAASPSEKYLILVVVVKTTDTPPTTVLNTCFLRRETIFNKIQVPQTAAPVLSATISDSQTILLGHADGTITMHHSGRGDPWKRMEIFSGEGEGVKIISFSDNNETFVCATDQEVRLYSLDSQSSQIFILSKRVYDSHTIREVCFLTSDVLFTVLVNNLTQEQELWYLYSTLV